MCLVMGRVGKYALKVDKTLKTMSKKVKEVQEGV